jgi:hypothetical protein
MNTQSSIYGLVVIARTNWFARKEARTPFREPEVSGTPVEILNRYKGIEGHAWPTDPSANGLVLSSGFAPIEKLSDVLYFLEKLRRVSNESFDLILCDRCANVRQIRDFQFSGFDYGYYDCESNSYSFVFNEIIYCRFPECRPLASALNANLLFDSIEDLKRAEACRAKLLQEGKNLEDDDEFIPLAIYTLKDGVEG